MNIQRLADALHPLERKVLPLVKAHPSPEAIAKTASLKDVEVMRALGWLESKGLVQLQLREHDMVMLDENGVRYKKDGLPERRFLKALSQTPMVLGAIPKKAGLTKEEANICIGILRQKAAILLTKGKELMVSLSEQGKRLQEKTMLEEQLLDTEFPRPVSALRDEERAAVETLRKRKAILHVERVKQRSVTITPLGDTLLGLGVSAGNVIDALTPQLLSSGEWKGKRFRRYDITAPVPRLSGGRRHFVEEAIASVRQIWLEMGFTEMTGTMVQTAFWNFDTLFVPQDHPAREMQDTFFLEGKGAVPADIARRIKPVHENGGDTGSAGWGGEWTEEIASKLLLRTHTTCLSAHTIAALKQSQLPAKFFCVGKVFRNETLDWKHLFEFHQVEGIVVDPDATLRQLISYLREFYAKMGFPDVRVRPSFFPYTEPSVEVEVFHPGRKEWIELGGAGIFRPEVTKPLLGIDVPVLAWGQGLERIITDYYHIKDLREIYKNDLEQLRTIKAWVR
jgi:phenylalanyl-tRNA synthetase alpha chain